MTFQHDYAVVEPTREAIDAVAGLVLVEFGAPWCPHCIAAQGPLAQALTTHESVVHDCIAHDSIAHDSTAQPTIAHYKIEDGPGRLLGRSFRVKLWPTLILLRDGVEVARVVRPTKSEEVERALFPM